MAVGRAVALVRARFASCYVKVFEVLHTKTMVKSAGTSKQSRGIFKKKRVALKMLQNASHNMLGVSVGIYLPESWLARKFVLDVICPHSGPHARITAEDGEIDEAKQKKCFDCCGSFGNSLDQNEQL